MITKTIHLNANKTIISFININIKYVTERSIFVEAGPASCQNCEHETGVSNKNLQVICNLNASPPLTPDTPCTMRYLHT